MSFRRYVYYCAWCGGIAAYGSWALGYWLTFENWRVQAGCKGFLFGFLVATTLGVIEVLWNLPAAKVRRIACHAAMAGAVGALGGALGSVLGAALYQRLPFEMVRLPGWFCTGLLIGAGLSVFDVIRRLVVRQSVTVPLIRMRRAALGGALGGFLGGSLYLLAFILSHSFFTDTDPLWSPDAWGQVALGACIGLGAALAQVFKNGAGA